MAKRSFGRRLLLALALLLVVATGVGVLKSGGIPSALQVPDGASVQTAAMLPGVSCNEVVIPVQLSEEAWFSFDVVGDLCRPEAPTGNVLQVLVSGSGYGSAYWDFPYQADTYSYVRAALRAGYSTFSFDRLGIGRSDHPLGALLTVDRQAAVLGQVIAFLKQEYSPTAVVTVGHSFGSVTSIANALANPGSVSGIVLTGFAHNTNPGFTMAMRDGVDLAAFSEPFAGRLVDPTYVISKPDSRADTFYTMDNTDPAVVQTDELNRQPTSVGEVISMSTYFGPQSRDLAVPVLLLVGENDFVVCGGALDCTDHAAVLAHEAEFFGPAACLETVVVDDTDHNANLHRNAPDNFAIMLDWVSRRVGTGGGEPPADPCLAG